VDALAAVTTPVTAVGDPKFDSLNWGLVEIGPTGTYQDVKTVTLRNYSGEDIFLDVAAMFTSDFDGATLTPNVSEVTVPAHQTAMVEFTLELDATQLPIDFEVMEEYFGYVTFTEDDGNLLRLPFYFVPRPYTTLSEIDADTSIEFNDLGYVDLNQAGPIPSSLWAYPVFMQSDNDPGVMDAGDLRYVGLDYGWDDPSYGDIFVPAFAMWGDAHTNQPFWGEIDMHIYAHESGDPYVVNFNYNYGWYQGSTSNNTWVVIQVDYVLGQMFLASPYTIYADFNSGFQEWYLPASWQYITDSFEYEVVSYDWYGASDYAGWANYDLTQLPMMWGTLDISSNPLLTPHNELFSLVFAVDSPGGYLYSKPEGIMLVDYFGKPGIGQAYFWEVELDHPAYYFPLVNQPGVD
jgi:hypothetical protein